MLQLLRFPVLGPPGWEARETSAREDGTPCPTSGSGYRSAGAQHPAERPVLYDSFAELRRGDTVGHAAMDITCAYGAPVVASTDGKIPLQVRMAGQIYPGAGASPKGGNYVWIEDPLGFRHYYAHMRNVRVLPGQLVRAGDLLGECSDTGNARGSCPHLHYAITDKNGVKVNPYKFLLPLYNRGDWRTEPNTMSGFPWFPLVLAAVAAGVFYLTVKKS